MNPKPLKVSTFSVEQSQLLECGRAIARNMTHHHQAYHHEYINQHRPNPRLFSVRDHVLENRYVKSIKKRGLVGKLMDSYTGPWNINVKIKGS